MKNRYILLILIFSFVVIGCTTQISEIEPTTMSMPVPAPGFENVPEMIVQEDLEESVKEEPKEDFGHE